MAESDLRNLIMNFRVSDLQVLLGFTGRNKTGKKSELQTRALELLRKKSPAVEMKIRELHDRRYNNALVHPSSGYELRERPVNDRPLPPFDNHMNNNYVPRSHPGLRPNPLHQVPSASYPSGKSYLPPQQNPYAPYNSYVDVQFKELPFYDVLAVVTGPTSIMGNQSENFIECSMYFTLTPQHAQEVSLSRKASGNYECQLMLRFAVLDTSAEQDDNFPTNLSIKVNNKVVTLPPTIPTNRPGVEPKRQSKPVNITSLSKLSPTLTNIINITCTATYGRSYVATLFLVRQLTPYILLQRLKSNGIRNSAFTTDMIKEKLQQGQDLEIATTSLQASLVCPLGKVKMELPCRALTCTHLQCFDAMLYLQMNEKKPKWICPVCDKPALYKTLVIDGLFIDIAKIVPPECKEVEFHEDGSWKPILPAKEPKEIKKVEKKKERQSVEVVDISDSESQDEWTYDLSSAASKNGASTNQSLSPPPASPPIASLYPIMPNFDQLAEQMLSTGCADMIDLMRDQSDNMSSILPDLVTSHTDSSMPSTSSSSPGLNSAIYYPYNDPSISSNDQPYYPPITSHIESTVNGGVNVPNYNSFDFYSLIPPLPDMDSSDKLKDTEKDKSSPDVISLD